MESLKSYLKIYLYGLAVILISILCVSLSGAIDPYSAKYRVKLFVLGSTMFFFGSTFFILKFSPCKIENATLKEFYKGTFESISGTAKLFQFLYAALGMALSVYIIFAEQWHLARGFAKISALLSCTLIAGSAVIRIAHSFISVPLDTGSAEKESKEPVVLLVLLLVASLFAGFESAQSLLKNDYYAFSYQFDFVRFFERQKINKIFTPEFLEKEVKFSIVSDDDLESHYYVAYNETEDGHSLVKSSVRHILERSLEEDANFYLKDEKAILPLKSSDIEKILKDNNSGSEAENAFFTNDLSDKEMLSIVATSIYQSDVNIVMGHTDSVYDKEFIAAWDIPTYCELSGIDLSSENWYKKVTENGDYIITTKDFIESVCFDSETENTYGFILNFGTENSLAIPCDTVYSVIKEHSQKQEEEKSL